MFHCCVTHGWRQKQSTDRASFETGLIPAVNTSHLHNTGGRSLDMNIYRSFISAATPFIAIRRRDGGTAIVPWISRVLDCVPEVRCSWGTARVILSFVVDAEGNLSWLILRRGGFWFIGGMYRLFCGARVDLREWFDGMIV